MNEYTVTFNVHLEPTEPYDLEEGTMIYDGYTVTGMRVHVIKEDMDAPVVWNNALIISEDRLYINQKYIDLLKDIYYNYDLPSGVDQKIEKLLGDLL